MARVVIVTTGDRVGRDLSFVTHHSLHLLMDFLTCGLWIPIHIRSTRKVKAAMRARTQWGFQR